uniref:Reverse transcriptase domain-containing protein n=1 Tax=Eptatretus burgeri TaxID=7764 RepID=A0A8C4Q2U1_EPTBU
MLLHYLLFAVDCTLFSHNLEEVQFIVNSFAQSAHRYGLTISFKKTEAMLQRRPEGAYTVPHITIDDTPLKVVDKFCYLGGVLSHNAMIDDEVTSRRSLVLWVLFGRLTHRLWHECGIRLDTRISVYRAVVLVFGDENLGHPIVVASNALINSICDAFIRFLASPGETIPNTSIQDHCRIQGIEYILMQAQLHWSGHLTRMEDHRIPKALFYGQLKFGQQSRGGQRKRYKDVLKSTLKSYAIPVATWEHQATNTSAWHNICHKGLDHFECGDLLSRDSGGKKRKPSNVHLHKEQPIPAIFAVGAVGLYWITQPSHNAQYLVVGLHWTTQPIAQCTMLGEQTNEGKR